MLPTPLNNLSKVPFEGGSEIQCSGHVYTVIKEHMGVYCRMFLVHSTFFSNTDILKPTSFYRNLHVINHLGLHYIP